MFDLSLNDMLLGTIQFFAKSAGIYSSSTSGAPPEGLISVFLFAVLGAFCGMIAGFLLSQVLRYISFLLGRNMGGYGWVLAFALLGAMAFGWIEYIGQDD